MPMPANRKEDVWGRIDVRGTDECWPFTGAPNTYGYGQMQIDGKHELVHRIAYELATGEVPGPLLVCHSCDNPRCCNPAHLFLGTVADNNRDAVMKGRNAHGERAGSARLRVEQVREIRALHDAGAKFVDIAVKFGVTPENISCICRRLTWRHV